MDPILHTLHVILHVDVYLRPLIHALGPGVYVLLFAVIFAETGFVVTPLLPGDSLLFAAGALAATGSLDVRILAPVFIVAACVGDSVNYSAGRYLGPRILARDGRFLKRSHLEMTQRYFDRYGARTILFGRFVPFVRTVFPFMAGVGRMSYARFATFVAIGMTLWVGAFLGVGYFFGNVPVVEHNFTLAILVVVGLSLVPGAVDLVRHRASSRRPGDENAQPAES